MKKSNECEAGEYVRTDKHNYYTAGFFLHFAPYQYFLVLTINISKMSGLQ